MTHSERVIALLADGKRRGAREISTELGLTHCHVNTLIGPLVMNRQVVRIGVRGLGYRFRLATLAT